jgi:uncharacterized Ntn-hydrolase superfamily protein
MVNKSLVKSLGPSTFSIVALDRKNGDMGVAVQSKFIAVGSVVPWAKAGVGAVATQASANVGYGPRALRMLEEGLASSEVLERLLLEDEENQGRQVAIVDAKGTVAVHTGTGCMEWAGHVTGDGYSCQGNILAGRDVVESMARAYDRTAGDLIDRLLAALSAGQKAGGDRRGQQSAALLVVREKGGYEGFTDRYVDLRVDNSTHPIEELKRVFRIYDMTMLSREDPSNLIPVAENVARNLQRNLKRLGFYKGSINGKYDEPTKKALRDFVNVNNFENRMREDGVIWKSILHYMEDLAAKTKPKPGRLWKKKGLHGCRPSFRSKVGKQRKA